MCCLRYELTERLINPKFIRNSDQRQQKYKLKYLIFKFTVKYYNLNGSYNISHPKLLVSSPLQLEEKENHLKILIL